MSRFQSTVSTFAALGTIAVTSVTAYKVFEQHQQNSLKQQIVIEDLKRQIAEKQAQIQTANAQSQIQQPGPSVPPVPPLPTPSQP